MHVMSPEHMGNDREDHVCFFIHILFILVTVLAFARLQFLPSKGSTLDRVHLCSLYLCRDDLYFVVFYVT